MITQNNTNQISMFKKKLYEIHTIYDTSKISTVEQISKRKIYRLRKIEELSQNQIKLYKSNNHINPNASQQQKSNQNLSQSPPDFINQPSKGGEQIDEEYHHYPINSQRNTNNPPINSIQNQDYEIQDSRKNTKKSLQSKKLSSQKYCNEQWEINGTFTQKNDTLPNKNSDIIQVDQVISQIKKKVKIDATQPIQILPNLILIQKNAIIQQILPEKIPQKTQKIEQIQKTILKPQFIKPKQSINDEQIKKQMLNQLFKKNNNQSSNNIDEKKNQSLFKDTKLDLKPRLNLSPVPNLNFSQKKVQTFNMFLNFIPVNVITNNESNIPKKNQQANHKILNNSNLFISPNTFLTSKINNDNDKDNLYPILPSNQKRTIEQVEQQKQSESHENTQSEKVTQKSQNSQYIQQDSKQNQIQQKFVNPNQIFEKEANHFRKNAQTLDVITNVKVYIQKVPQKNQNHLVIRNLATRIIIYQGLLMLKQNQLNLQQSKVQYLNKKRNIKIYPLYSQVNGKLQKDMLKIQFKVDESGIKFTQVIKSLNGQSLSQNEATQLNNQTIIA